MFNFSLYKTRCFIVTIGTLWWILTIKIIGSYRRSQDAFVDYCYSIVLDSVMSFRVREYGDLTTEQGDTYHFFPRVVCRMICILGPLTGNRKQLKVYNPLRKDLSQISKDFSKFKNQRALRDLRNW